MSDGKNDRQGIVLLSGYAKLPANITSEEIYKTLVLVVLVDLEHGTIVDAECSVVTELARKFIARLMVGYQLDNGWEELFNRFERRYFGQAKKAIETSIKMIFSKYNEIMNKG